MFQWPKSKRQSARMAAAMLGALALSAYPSNVEPREEPDKPKEITQHDLDCLERARLKRERKAAKKSA